ncbi:hypothetical protein CSW49_03900 [Thermus scotoductus]|nr:hypothetical protein CSW49_03900 [Thermus scotoductus]
MTKNFFVLLFFDSNQGLQDPGTAYLRQLQKCLREMVGAGSVITHDVPEDALAVARERQRNLEGYARRKLEGD